MRVHQTRIGALSNRRSLRRNSVELALASTAVAMAVALPAAFAPARHRFPGLLALAAFWTLPLALPHVAIGVGMLRLPQASVEQLDRAREEAASSLGAGPIRRFLYATLPGLTPGLAAASIVSFLISFGEVTVTSFLTTARLTTLPVRIYAEATFSLEPTVHAVSTLLIVTTSLALILLNRAMRLDRLHAR